MADEQRRVKRTGEGAHRHGTLRAAVKPSGARRSAPVADDVEESTVQAAEAAQGVASSKAAKAAAQAAKAAKNDRRELS